MCVCLSRVNDGACYDDDVSTSEGQACFMMVHLLGVILSGLLILIVLCIALCRIKFRRKAPAGRTKQPTVVAFFHPFCGSGGGGERVLWKAIQVLGDMHDKGIPLKVIIYTIDAPKLSYKEGVIYMLVIARAILMLCVCSFLPPKTCFDRSRLDSP